MSSAVAVRLTLQFATRSRLFTEVVHALGKQLYVETPLALAVGARVEVVAEAAGLAVPLVLEGQVAGVVAASPGRSAGVIIDLTPEAVERCRAALNASRSEAVRTAGRAEARVEGQLPARVVAPEAVAGCTLKGFSSNGLTLKAPRPLAQGSKVEVAVTVGATEVRLTGVVSWVRAELGLAGVRLEAVDPALAERLSKALAEGQGAAQAPMATVVVADDDPAITSMLGRLVADAGHKVVSTARGDDALEAIRCERPAVALLDILMPGLDGLEVCKAVRQDAGLRQLKVVMLSAMSEERLAQVAKDAGADAWLTKPMRIALVRELLEKLLR